MPVIITPYVSVLIVADGVFSFISADPTDYTFTLQFLVETLRSTAPGVGFKVTTAHRNADTSASLVNFKFSEHDLSQFDEIWMFGYEGTNYNLTPVTDSIDDDELAAISNFMANGGGVLAVGDHDGLGAVMCGKIPRVRSMRRWYAAQDLGITPTVQANAPGNGPGRLDTTRADHAGQFWFDNQSDDIPQTFTLLEPHPVFHSSSGLISSFPDHMHEGEVATPTVLSDVLTFAGQQFEEYPERFFLHPFEHIVRPIPRIIATGVTIPGHQTPLEQSELGPFQGAGAPEQGQTFNAICVYDGSAIGLGRVLTQSSFHHFIDLNLIGDPLGVGSKKLGFNTVAGAPVLAGMQQYFRNVGHWLAEHQHFYIRLIEYLIQLPWWIKLFNPGGPVEERPEQIFEYGALMRQALARYGHDGLTSNFVRSYLTETSLANLFPEDPWRNRMSQESAVLRGRILDAALGSLAMTLMAERARGGLRLEHRHELKELTRAAVQTGMRALGRFMEREVESQRTVIAALLAQRPSHHGSPREEQQDGETA